MEKKQVTTEAPNNQSTRPPVIELFSETPEDVSRVLGDIARSTNDLSRMLSDHLHDLSLFRDQTEVDNILSLMSYIQKFRNAICLTIKI